MKVAAAEGRAVGIVQYFRGSVPSSGRTFLYFGSIDDIQEVEDYQLELDESVLPRVVSLDSPTLSESLFAARILPSGDLLLVRPDFTWERRTVEGEAGPPKVIGDEVLYEHFRFAAPSSFEVARFGEPAQELLVDPGAFLLALHVDWANRQMTWIRAESPGAYRETTRTDIYTAPLTTDPTMLEPRLVRNLYPETDDSLTRWGSAISGDGFFANYSPTFFVSLNDGTVSRLPTDHSRDINGTLAQLWIADGYRYLSTANGSAMPPGLGGTLLRQRLDSLIPD